jgi:hypothetical protein
MHVCQRAVAEEEGFTSTHSLALVNALGSGGISLQHAVHRICSRLLLKSLAYQVCHGLFVQASPVLAYILLKWLTRLDQSTAVGYAASFGIAGCAFAAAVLRRASAGVALQAGLRARAALCGLAYMRAQQLDWASLSAREAVNADHHDGASSGTEAAPSQGDADLTTAPLGRLSDLMGSAADRVLNYMPAMVEMIVLPIEIAIALSILYVIVGVASLGAVGVMLTTLAASQAGGLLTESLTARKAAVRHVGSEH